MNKLFNAMKVMWAYLTNSDLLMDCPEPFMKPQARGLKFAFMVEPGDTVESLQAKINKVTGKTVVQKNNVVGGDLVGGDLIKLPPTAPVKVAIDAPEKGAPDIARMPVKKTIIVANAYAVAKVYADDLRLNRQDWIYMNSIQGCDNTVYRGQPRGTVAFIINGKHMMYARSICEDMRMRGYKVFFIDDRL